ncbi:hypothetical protein ACFY36_10435 [Actinoplanes sp. NPDC000266]
MIGPADLLTAWESGLAAGNLQRALLLHALAAGRPEAELLAVPVARRDADLLALRRALFGERLPARMTCAGCDEELEVDMEVTSLIGAGPAAGEPVTVASGPWRVRVRPPTPGDLLAVAGSARAREALFARCLLEAERDGEPAGAADLPADVSAKAVAALAEADPCADIQLTVQCVRCGGPVRSALDVGSYLWAELDNWARATLLDIHLLASTYGWSEPDCLAVSPTRRRYYLELAGHA